jgi:serine/threonine-protein kinase
MFRLLTGRPVHLAETANETIIAAATVPAPSLGSIDPSLSRTSAIVDRALMQDPACRWQSAVDMRVAIEQQRRGLPGGLPAVPGRIECDTVDESMLPSATGDARPPAVLPASSSSSSPLRSRLPGARARATLFIAALVATGWFTLHATREGPAATSHVAASQSRSGGGAAQAAPPLPDLPSVVVTQIVPLDSAPRLRQVRARQRARSPTGPASKQRASSLARVGRLEDVLDERH